MISQLIQKYIALRDARRELADKFKEKDAKLAEAMSRIEGKLADHMKTSGVERMGTDDGVCFFSTVRSVTVADPTAFFNFLESTGRWDLADIRAGKKAVSDYRDEMDDLPPGIDFKEARVVRVNRS